MNTNKNSVVRRVIQKVKNIKKQLFLIKKKEKEPFSVVKIFPIEGGYKLKFSELIRTYRYNPNTGTWKVKDIEGDDR